MNEARVDLVAEALREPQRLAALNLPQWSLLIRQARQAGVLARIAWLCDERGITATLPEPVCGHLQSARNLAAAQQYEMAREVRYIQRALAPLGVPVILLKGAAYLLRDLPAARGRAFSDVDILVPKDRLPEVESALMLHGWITTHQSPYDQRYYREWMHELPPMAHLRRQSVLDVHHTILPETARLRPDPALLLSAAEPVPGWDGVAVLAPMDMILHSMTHLFHNDDLSRGLRDLSDLDLLLRHFAVDSRWWEALVDRAKALDLLRPLYYGLTCTRRILGTPVPDAAVQACGGAAPGRLTGTLMDALWDRTLQSQHATSASGWTPAALFLLYLRAHWLRMPPLSLVRHLTVKAFMRLKPERGEA